MQVLDVGCGTGFPLFELAQRLGSISRVYGLDLWKAALNRAKRKAQLWNVRNAELGQGDATVMPFRNGQFDLIVSNLGLNNFNDPEAVLAECRRVSKPSAKVVLTTNLESVSRWGQAAPINTSVSDVGVCKTSHFDVSERI